MPYAVLEMTKRDLLGTYTKVQAAEFLLNPKKVIEGVDGNPDISPKTSDEAKQDTDMAKELLSEAAQYLDHVCAVLEDVSSVQRGKNRLVWKSLLNISTGYNVALWDAIDKIRGGEKVDIIWLATVSLGVRSVLNLVSVLSPEIGPKKVEILERKRKLSEKDKLSDEELKELTEINAYMQRVLSELHD